MNMVVQACIQWLTRERQEVKSSKSSSANNSKFNVSLGLSKIIYQKAKTKE